MSFYVYMLRCRDGSYYLGHTDDLEKRIGEHQTGKVSAYTRKRRPVTLVFSEECSTREEALSREQQLKGWSRAKKEAMVAGNWDRVRRLARNARDVDETAAAHRAPASAGSAFTSGGSTLRQAQGER